MRALLTLRGRFGERGFHLGGLATALRAPGPAVLDLCFRVDASAGPSLILQCEHGGDAFEAGLRERLLRGDIAGRFDCQWLGDGQSVALPPHVLRVEAPAGALPSGKWIAFPAPLTSAAVAVLEDAVEQGYEAAYRITLHSRRADTGLARRLIPALAEVASRGRLAALEGCLRTTIEQMSQPGWYADETLLLPAGEALRTAVQSLVECELGAGTAFLGGDYWRCSWDEDFAGRADTGGADDTLLVQQARPATFLTDLFEMLLPSLPGDPLPQPRREAAVSAGDYVFVSYAHADRAYGMRIIEQLRKAGVRVWFDSGIDAGAVWDDALERRIREAGAIVACITSGYEASRYCTRELKFADLIGKPILPIAPNPWSWGPGLQLMFQELQICSYDEGRGLPAFYRALRAGSPQVFAEPRERSAAGALTPLRRIETASSVRERPLLARDDLDQHRAAVLGQRLGLAEHVRQLRRRLDPKPDAAEILGDCGVAPADVAGPIALHARASCGRSRPPSSGC